MAWREEMHSLAQAVIGAYEARIAGVAHIRTATEVLLKEFDENHQAMARRQRMDLAHGRRDLGNSVATQLKELDTDHQAMARRQRTDLAHGRRDLGNSVATQLKELDAGHQSMARQQRMDLAHGRRDLGNSVATQLKELDTDHQAMARQQRMDLAHGRRDLATAEVRRKSTVNAWIQEIATGHASAREEWHNLTTAMQAKRSGAVAVAEAPVAAAPPPPVALAPPPVAPVSPPAIEEPAVEEGEEELAASVAVGEVTPEFASLASRAFAHLAQHPDGTSLTELAGELGLARIQLARVVRNLMDEGKVEKRGLLYFAI